MSQYSREPLDDFFHCQKFKIKLFKPLLEINILTLLRNGKVLHYLIQLLPMPSLPTPWNHQKT